MYLSTHNHKTTAMLYEYQDARTSGLSVLGIMILNLPPSTSLLSLEKASESSGPWSNPSTGPAQRAQWNKELTH